MFHIPKKVSQIRQFGRFSPEGSKPLMAMVEVTNRCNMACPICYSDARHSAVDVSLESIHSCLLRLLDVTGTPIPIQISGGEPTLRDDLPQIITMARRLGYRNIELITNGIRIGNEPNFLKDLKKHGLTAVYLQFDGLKSGTTLQIRGQDMRETRQSALRAIREVGLCCTLAVVVTKGVSECEIGDIVSFAVDNIDVVRAINFQSATRLTGRFGIGENYQGYGLQELISLIEAETGIGRDTFLSKHLGHPSCNAMSPVFIVNGKLEPLFKYLKEEDLLAFLGEGRRDKILASFAGKKDFFFRYLLNRKAWQLIAKAAPIFGSNPYNVLKSKHLLIFAKAFMEKDSLDPERIEQCCYAITGAGGVFSFCAYNNLYRFAAE
jgi:uncharacterized radical SAM superfamily Fe-S cluster-containing enzyme